jgi:DNA-binding protein YbaB|tara:strand:- start:4462 stop:4737 length:276 start_codon:yes stop_codon:yes gene_type:complete
MKTSNIIKGINDLSDMQDLNLVINALKVKQKSLRNDLARTARSQFSVGDLVSVNAKGKILKGSITEIKIKNATVKINDILYNVPLSIMEAA